MGLRRELFQFKAAPGGPSQQFTLRVALTRPRQPRLIVTALPPMCVEVERPPSPSDRGQEMD